MLHPEVVDAIQAAAGVFSTIIAAFALYKAISTEKRGRLRFDKQLQLSKEQLEHQQKIADTNLRPILFMFDLAYVNRRGLILSNQGLGPAIITGAELTLGNKRETAIPDLFDFGRSFSWDTFWRFLDGEQLAIRPGDEITLMELRKSSLIDQGIDPDRAQNILDTIKEQLPLIQVSIFHTNVEHEVLPPCTWPNREPNAA